MPVQSTLSSTDKLIEVFSSIQGEGELAGYRQIFIRFGGCNLNCVYCDTSVTVEPTCRIETAPGSGVFEEIPQPVDLSTILEIVHRWCRQLPNAHNSISITGGEPLVHAELLKQWLPELNILLPIHLETNGSLPDSLDGLMEHVDFISMDIKLPGTAVIKPIWEEHRRFLEIGMERNISVKVVVSDQSIEDEFVYACKLVAGIDEEIPFIIQPMTGLADKPVVSMERIFHWQALASNLLDDVRVLPQMHRYLGIA